MFVIPPPVFAIPPPVVVILVPYSSSSGLIRGSVASGTVFDQESRGARHAVLGSGPGMAGVIRRCLRRLALLVVERRLDRPHGLQGLTGASDDAGADAGEPTGAIRRALRA